VQWTPGVDDVWISIFSGAGSEGALYNFAIFIQALYIGASQRMAMLHTAGKVTVGLASHWPCVTDWSAFIHLQAQWPPSKGSLQLAFLGKGFGRLYVLNVCSCAFYLHF